MTQSPLASSRRIGRPRLDPTRLVAPWRGWTGIVALAGVVYVLVLFLIFIVPPAGEWDIQLISDFGEAPLEAAGILLALAVVAREPRGRARLAWGFFAAALASDTIGGLIYGSYDMAGQQPFPSAADAFYLALYPLMLLGLLALPTASARRDLLAWRVWSNVAIVILGGGMALVYFVLLPTIGQLSQDPLATTISLAYPAGDLALITALATISARRPYAGDRGVLALLIVTVSFWFFADLVFAIISASGTYAFGNVADLVWLAGDLAFLLAARASFVSLSRPDRNAPGQALAAARLGPLVMLGLGLATLVTAAFGAQPEIAFLAVLAVLLTVLVVFRQLVDEYQRRQTEAALIEEQARAAERAVRDISERLTVEADEAREARIRVALTEALQHIAVNATVEEAGQAICDVLSTLPGIDFASIDGFFGEGEAVMVAGTVPAAFPAHPGDSLPPDRARYLQARAAQGPWAEYWAPTQPFGAWGQAVTQTSLQAAAFGPIVHGDHVDGVLVVGTADESFAQTLMERMPGLAAFTATCSGLLAERLHARRLEAERRASLTSILATAAFHPVFQPIVDLESGDVVGYEALTRFDSGQRPDLCFADAWSAGLGPELEIATLEAAVAASRGLPAGRWLSLNVSPRLLGDSERIGAVLRSAERPLVLEITEHDLIADYGIVREAIRTIGPDLRLAVDDAGAGIANFGHIIELHPDLVKLDISLVRGVNANLGRQAMVAGMSHFSRTAGCRLVADGVETEAEAATLRGLGVEFGQGNLFGHPEPAEAWLGPEALELGWVGGDRLPRDA